MCFPGVFPGIPVDENSAGLKSWFASCGWDLQYPKRLANMIIPELSSWSAPEGLLQNIQRASISFDLIHGLENAESVLNHVATHANPEVFELYKIALTETKTCGVVRAKSPVDSLLGTVIICSPGSSLAGYIPALQPNGGVATSPVPREQLIGGIIAPIVPSTAQAALVLQGLALMGVRQNKAHKSGKSVLSWVLDEAYEPLLAMGFDVLQAFEELTNSPENVSGLP
jgi:beta-N-acetylhexosaminidase